jgi:hypothetical protein
MGQRDSKPLDSPHQEGAKRSPQRWKALALACIGLISGSLIALYVWVTSPAFFKDHVLPRIGRRLEAETSVTNGICMVHKGRMAFTAQEAKLSGFFAVVFGNCSIFVVGQDPALTINQLKLSFGPPGLFRPTPRLVTATIMSPKIRVLRTNDESNLDPMLEELRTFLSTTGRDNSDLFPKEIEVRDCSIQITRYSRGPNGIQQDGSINLTMSITNRNISPNLLEEFLKKALPFPFGSGRHR